MLRALEERGLVAALGGRHDEPRELADVQTLLRPNAPRGQRELEQAVRTIWRLRQDDGCPWDREQTHASIAKNMIEEAYEAVDAIEAGDAAHLREELGDVLMQVLLHAQIAEDAGEFTFADICRDLDDKLVRRHPHVFGSGVAAHDSAEVLDIWSKVKLDERRDAEQSGSTSSLLDAVPRALPALMQAQKISKKAANCGFDWETTADVWAKVDEERAEFAAEETGSEGALEEFGDVLFSVVNVARKEHIDAETALRRSCEKFRERWAAMEKAAAEKSRSLADVSREELEQLWTEAKRAGRSDS
ncbi:nucleoside triphosphate pyrophosphohydrolase [uncultured Parolsenella sp.]|uniref:nucleoside triphosphate pyrophosphohydrolase n=1 Tax=uncultured Parolsenella sp. TaxID=2083008 RepID=UPI0025CDB665|nr:nucleoside triphosphate pyrophosphohydrolase [uncultured Parolsenella sp.]